MMSAPQGPVPSIRGARERGRESVPLCSHQEEDALDRG